MTDSPREPTPMSDALVEELDRRKAAALRDPSSLVPWDTIRQRLGLSSGDTSRDNVSQ